jgi:hypothetical protein
MICKEPNAMYIYIMTSCYELCLLLNNFVSDRIHNSVQYSISVAVHFCQKYICNHTNTKNIEGYKPTKAGFVKLKSISPLSYSV